MLNPISHGHFLPFSTNRFSATHTMHSGYGIDVSDTRLTSFQFEIEDPGPSIVVNFWALRSLDGGQDIILPFGLLQTHALEDRIWISYFGGDLGQTIPCGKYEIEVKYAGQSYWSAAIVVKDVNKGYVRAGLKIDDTTGIPTTSIVVDDIKAGALTNEVFQVSTDQVNWSNQTLPLSFAVTDNLYLRRSISNQDGSSSAYYRLVNGILTETGYTSTPGETWKLEISSDQPHNRILYHRGFTKIYYFIGPLSTPTFEDEPDVLENGNGASYLRYAQVSDGIVVTALNVPDSALSGFYEGKHHTTKITRVGGDELITQGYEIAVQASGGEKNIVTLTFPRATYVTRACEDELNVVP